jgi:putative transposon-encoded protein
LGWQTVSDTTGSVFIEPYPIKATNDLWDHLITVFADTATRIGVYGAFTVPKNYVGTAQLVIVWTTTAITGDVEWDFDYRAVGGDDAESFDQTGTQESVNLNDTAPSAAHERMVCTINLTSGNLAADDVVEYFLARDGTDAGDTIAAAVMLFEAYFQYADA